MSSGGQGQAFLSPTIYLCHLVEGGPLGIRVWWEGLSAKRVFSREFQIPFIAPHWRALGGFEHVVLEAQGVGLGRLFSRA